MASTSRKAATTCLLVLACGTPAALAVDLATLQQQYVNQCYGLFMHYSMGTYTNEEWAHSGVNMNTFNPGARVNTNQWAQVALNAGMAYGVLTTKHHDGFALWNTAQSTYDIASTSWYATYHQDIVADYVNSFRQAGLGVGLYYSVWDKYNGIGPRLYADDAGLAAKTSADATAYVKAEIHDLLTSYGHIDVLWTDGWGWNNTSNGAPYSLINYADLYGYIKSVSPNTLLINNVNEGTLTHTDVVGFEYQYSGQIPAQGNTLPSEASVTLRSNNSWFYTGGSNGDAVGYKSATVIGSQILTLNARNSSYLLDVPPDRNGPIPAAAVSRLNEIKAYLDATPAPRAGNLALGKSVTQSSDWNSSYGAANAVDGNRSNYAHTATVDVSPFWKVDFGSLVPIAEVDLFNRADGYDGRLRDILIDIIAGDGTTLLTSPLLNPGNALGGGQNDYAVGPYSLSWILPQVLEGRYVRIRRIIETGGVGNTDDRRVLTLAEVEVYSAAVPEPASLAVLTFGGAVLLTFRRRS